VPATITRGRVVVGAVIVVVVGVLFRINQYQYVAAPDSVGVTASPLLRVNRLTGMTQEFVDGRWFALAPRPLPSVETPKLIGYGEFGSDGIFRGNLHNGSGWTVTRVAIRLSLNLGRPQAGETAWDRRFEIHLLLPPLSTSVFHVIVSDPREISSKGLTFKQWWIVDTIGFPTPSLTQGRGL